jgi:CBS domain-containing protein
MLFATSLSLLFSFSCAFSGPRVFVSTPSKLQQRLVQGNSFTISNVILANTSSFALTDIFMSQDYMTHSPKTLQVNESVDDAIAKLLSFGYSGAPVVDSQGSLVGVVSAFDFLQKEAGGALLPMEGTSDKVDKYMKAAKKIMGSTVADLMTPDPLSVGPHESMRTAAAMMTQERLHRLPVVDSEGDLVGILSTSDVMRDVLYKVRMLEASSSLDETKEGEESSELNP